MPYGSDPTAPQTDSGAMYRPTGDTKSLDEVKPGEQLRITVSAGKPPANPKIAEPFPGLNPALAPIVQRESGGKPFVGYTPPGQSPVDLSNAPLDDTGFPIWDGNIDPSTGMRSHAAGIAQIQPGTWRPIAKKLGIKDFSLESQIKVANELHAEQGDAPWKTSAGGYGKDPVVGSGKWNVSTNAIQHELGRSNTDVRWMSPDDYLALVPPVEEGESKPRRQSLLKSLDSGQEVEDLPSLDVKPKGGKLTVFDQDGRNRAMVAKEAGVDLIPVAIHGVAKSENGPESIIGMNGKELPYRFKSVEAPKLPPAAPSMIDRFGTGVRDVVGGTTQLAEHLMPAALSQGINSLNNTLAHAGVPLAQVPEGGVDQMERERERQIEDERKRRGETGTDWARVGGQIAGTAVATAPLVGSIPAIAGSNMLRALATGAVEGAAGGAIAPVTQGNYWQQKATEIPIGAATGAGVGAAGNAVANMIVPPVSNSLRRLADAGVNLTPGRVMGQTASRIEDKLTSLPIVGDIMQAGMRRSLRDFNHAVYDKVLEKIGQKASRKAIGYEGEAEVESKLNAAYDALKSKIHFQADAKFMGDLTNLTKLASEMPPDQVRQFTNVLNNRVLERLKPKGYMDGATFKQVEGELSNFSRQYKRSSDAAQRQLADAVDSVNGLLRENLERINPSHRKELRDVNTAWAAFKRLQGAVSRRVSSGGIFTPGDLLATERQMSGKGVFARGDGMLREIADDAEKSLPSKYPDSGTAGRLAAIAATGEGLHAFGLLFNPKVMGLVGATAAGYNPLSMMILRRLAQSPSPTRNALSQIPRTVSNALAPGAGFIGGPGMGPTPP